MAKKAKNKETEILEAPAKKASKTVLKTPKKSSQKAKSPKKITESAKKTGVPAKKKATAMKNIAASEEKKAEAAQKSPKKSRKPHATRPTPEEEIIIAERRELVLDLRKAGCSIRQISRHLENAGYEHFSPATVCADLEAELEARKKVRLQKTDLLVEMELSKIDDMELTVSPTFKRTKDVNIGYFLVTLQNQRDKYMNISKKQQSEISAAEALSKLTGVPLSQLPKNESGKE